MGHRYRPRVSPLHRACSFALWYGLAGYVAWRQVEGMAHHTWPVRSGLTVLACLAIWLHPPHQAHHWITYHRFRGLLYPLNGPLWLVGIMPVSPLVNYTEMRIRRLLGIHVEWPGTLIALPTVGLLPLWLLFAFRNWA